MPEFSRVIETLSTAREKLLVRYCHLLALDIDEMEALKVELRDLGQQLTDYCALGQFGLVENLPAGTPSGEGGKVDSGLLERLQQSTAMYLDFVECCLSENGAAPDLNRLCGDIEALGQSLAERFEIEDKLIRATTLSRSPALHGQPGER